MPHAITFDVQEAVTISPHLPGEHSFYSSDRQLLYIGKAVDLKKRLRQHFPTEGKTQKRPTRQQIAAASSSLISWIVTESELHALVLEDELIKAFLPITNKRQKKFLLQEYIGVTDNKKRSYISCSVDTPLPSDVMEHFGPFSDSFVVDDLFEIGNRYFGIRRNGFCLGDLMPETKADHQTGTFPSFLRGENEEILKHQQWLMEALAARREFERAGKVRDDLEFCRRFLKRQRFNQRFRHECLAIVSIDGAEQTWFFSHGKLILHTRGALAHGTVARNAVASYLESELVEEQNREPDWVLFDRGQVVFSWLYKNRELCDYWFCNS